MPNLPRAGHHPGHHRDAFVEAVENSDNAEMVRLAGRLWSCTDVLPGEVCSMLDLRSGSTYAQAARKIRRWDRHPFGA